MTVTDYRARLWNDTDANLVAANPVPLAGEAIVTTDKNELRVGDGTTAYTSLPMFKSSVLPAGYLYGLETEPDTDADHDVKINIGKCRDYADTVDITLGAAMIKRVDATWAAGTTNGGLFTGSVAVDTTYHYFLIVKDSDGSIDAGWDTDIDCANIPTGYTEYRRIASFLTDSSANILKIRQSGDDFIFDSPINDLDRSTQTAGSATTRTLSIPSNVAHAYLSVSGYYTGAATTKFFHPSQTTFTPVISTAAGIKGELCMSGGGGDNDTGSLAFKQPVLNGGCVTVGSHASFLSISTLGYFDDRGQHGGK